MAPVTILLISAISLVGLTFIFLLALYWISRTAFIRSGKDTDAFDGFDAPAMAPFKEESTDRITRLLNEEYEDVYITSTKGSIRLHGRLYFRREGAPFQVMAHGYRSNPYRDFSGGALEALEGGYNLLLIDQRAHHLESEGRFISFGIYEKYDLVDWTEYIADRFPDCDIIPIGISMGGATVVQASALPMPEAVRCVIADCPYAEVKDILIHTAKKMGFPAAVYPIIRLSARIFCGFDPEDSRATEAARSARVPILIIHGDSDGMVPEEHSARLSDANPNMIERHLFAGANHGLSYLVDRDKYMNTVAEFISRHTN